ncbi:MAG: flagellar hook-basal body complex protein [Rhodospirillaceae bacterium]
MTIQGAFTSALNGMGAFSSAVGNISDNLANVGTIGFKRVDTTFKDLMGAPEVSYKNPVSVRALPIYRDDVAGGMVRTDNPTAFAVTQGAGFVPVADIRYPPGATTAVVGLPDSHFTRAADFQPDLNGYLVNSGGQVLLAMPENTTFSGKFPVLPTGAGLVPVRVDPTKYLKMPGVQSTTVNVNANFPALAPVGINPAGGGPAAGAGPGDQTASIGFYDSTGMPHSMAITFRKTAVNSWEAIGGLVNDAPSQTITLNPPYPTVSFSPLGALTAVTKLDIPIPTVQDKSNPLGPALPFGTLTLDMGTPTGDSTQYSGTQIEVRYQTDLTGSPAGDFTSASVNDDGSVVFKYSNGHSIDAYRVPLATFTNPNLLERVTGATFGSDPLLAGTSYYGWPGNPSVGNIVSGATESSNVDIGTELVKMITAQRAYSSNSKIISTCDAMTETAIGLKG